MLRRATLVAAASLALVAPSAASAAGASPTEREDTVSWQSDVGTARSGTSVLAETDLAVHRVDVAIATPGGVSKATVARWIREQDVDRLLARVSTYWSTQSGKRIRFVRSTSIKRFATGDGANCRSTTATVYQVRKGGVQHYGSNWLESSTRGPERREHLVVLYPYHNGDYPRSSRYGSTCNGMLGLGSVPSRAGRNSPGGWSFSLFGGPNGATRDDRFGHYQYYKGVATLAHELGHNLGLRHSGVGWCTPRADGSFKSARCDAIEGLDPLDLMGWDVAARGVSPLSGAQKLRLGVLPDSEVRVVTTSSSVRTVKIAARHRQNSLRTLIKAVDPESKNTYYIELRRSSPGLSFGYIGGMPWRAESDYRVSYGVTISRVAPGTSTWAVKGEHLVVPVGATSSRRSWLREGETFTSRTGRLKIKVIDSASTTATVRISFPRG